MTFAIDAFVPGAAVASAPMSISSNSRDALAEPLPVSEIASLNKVVVAVLDNADEYRRAIFAVEQMLNSLQQGLYNRVQAAEHLQSRVRALGAQPATSLSSLAAVFAARLSTRGTLAKDRPEDLLHDVARGAVTLRTQFQKQLADTQLSTASRECIKQALAQVSADRHISTEKWDPFDVVTPRPLLAPVVNLRSHATMLAGEGSPAASMENPHIAVGTSRNLTNQAIPAS
jgi:uncharacterized protein (TIGR02284 family)